MHNKIIIEGYHNVSPSTKEPDDKNPCHKNNLNTLRVKDTLTIILFNVTFYESEKNFNYSTLMALWGVFQRKKKFMMFLHSESMF